MHVPSYHSLMPLSSRPHTFVLMQWMWRVPRLVWRGVFFSNTLITFFLLAPVFYSTVFNERTFRVAFFFKRVWAYMMTLPLGIITLVDKDEDWPEGAFLITPNHTSYLDIMVSYIAFPKYFHYMGKAELSNWWFFNIFFKKMNISIDRESMRRSYGAYQRAADDVAKGIPIAVYPEAMIPLDTPRLKTFKNAPFRFAIEQQIPVLPVTFINNWNILPADPNHWTGGRPGFAKVRLHRAVSTEGLTLDDVETLRQRVQQIIQEELDRHGDN